MCFIIVYVLTESLYHLSSKCYCIRFSGALMYFGGTLLTTSLFQNNEHCGEHQYMTVLVMQCYHLL